MRVRMALVACVKPYEGVWTTARGNEVGVHISTLQSGESVRVELDGVSPVPQVLTFDQPGTHHFTFGKHTRYRIGKGASSDAKLSPTNVGVVLDG